MIQQLYPHSQRVPGTFWFVYQAWLTQNYIIAVSDYAVLPAEFLSADLIVAFKQPDHLDRFKQRWSHTFTHSGAHSSGSDAEGREDSE